MSISTFVQRHYRREQVLSIDRSLHAVRAKFIQLSMTDIICGHLATPLISSYKLKVWLDRDSIYVDGLYGIKMMPFVTKITLQLSPSQNGVILTIVSQLPIKYINELLVKTLANLLIFILAVYAMTLLLSGSISSYLIGLGMCYVFSWLHFRYVSKIVFEFLHRELATIERAS